VVKVAYVARFKHGMTREAASGHWTDVHGPLGLALEGVTGYVQNHVRATSGAAGLSEADRAFDGYGCEWWADQAAFERGMKSPEWEAVVQDGYNVFEVDSLEGMSAVLEERVMRDGPRSPFKVVWFAKWLPHLSSEEASGHWLNVHGPIALGAPGIDRYVQNRVVASIDGDRITDRPAGFDGFSECWFADLDAYQQAVSSPEWALLVEDGPKLMDMEALEAGMSAVVEERVIRDPEPTSAA
jgi:uncharacterized protein (TIGR02118 family)